jgi:hypothetical protein
MGKYCCKCLRINKLTVGFNPFGAESGCLAVVKNLKIPQDVFAVQRCQRDPTKTMTTTPARCHPDKPEQAHGFCHTCYQRAKYWFDPADRQMRRQVNLARYYQKKEHSSGAVATAAA